MLKSFAVTSLVATLIITLTMLINLIQPDFSLIDCLLEASAACSTTGLTTGITRSLSPLSKILVLIGMFAGRVGPISFALAFSLAKKGQSNTIYPDGKFVVG